MTLGPSILLMEKKLRKKYKLSLKTITKQMKMILVFLSMKMKSCLKEIKMTIPKTTTLSLMMSLSRKRNLHVLIVFTKPIQAVTITDTSEMSTKKKYKQIKISLKKTSKLKKMILTIVTFQSMKMKFSLKDIMMRKPKIMTLILSRKRNSNVKSAPMSQKTKER